MIRLLYAIPSLGQFIQGRIVAGLTVAITFYGSIVVLLVIWKGINWGFYFLIITWVYVWYISYIDALRGRKSTFS